MSGFYFMKYMLLQMKRVLYRIPMLVAGTLLLAGSLAMVLLVLADNLKSDEKQMMVEVGVTGEVSNEYVTMAIAALRSLDDSRFAVNLKVLEEDSAREQLVQGKLAAYFVVPEGIVEAIMYGESFQIKYYTCKDQAGLGTLLVNEFSEVLYKLLTKSQNGIYGLQELCREYADEAVLWEGTEELNIEYVTFMLERQNVYELQVLGISNELSTAGYYICSLLIVFFMLFGLHGCALYITKDLALKKLLAVRGCSPALQVISEFLSYSILMMAASFGVLATAGAICNANDIRTAEWNFVDLFTLWNFGGRLLPVMLMFTAMALLGHELAGNMVSGLLLQFLLTVGMGYVSGCFYPSGFFPETIRQIGRMLPSGVALNYAARSMLGKSYLQGAFEVGLYALIFLSLTFVLRKRKLLQDGIN